MKTTTSQAGAIAAISSASAPNVLTCPFLSGTLAVEILQ